MIYSKTCEYAIRALLYLSQRPKGEFAMTKEISAQTGVPSAYLSKIFRDLTHHGILRSRRGAAGGVALAVDPAVLSLYRIVSVIDDPARLKVCVMGLDQCSEQNACPLHAVWAPAKVRMIEKMQNCTLSSITKKIACSRYRKTDRGRLNQALFLSSSRKPE